MIRMDREGSVGIMTMDYKSDNRFNPDFVRAMMAELDKAEKDPEIGALVITGGDPKFFSNGLDLDWLMANEGDMDTVLGYLGLVNSMLKRWTLYPKPTVAALNGHTFAAGLFMAAHMDFRLMREDRGWICLPEVDINIPLLPGMIAICQATMRPDGFRKLYYTGTRMTGPEAVEIGFVESIHSLDDLLPASVEFASMLAQKKTATYAKMKQCVRQEIARILEDVDPLHFEETISLSTAP